MIHTLRLPILLAAIAFAFAGRQALDGQSATGPKNKAPKGNADLQRRFVETVRPFLEQYCLACHGDKSPKADFDLSRYASVAAVVKDIDQWEEVLQRLHKAKMPPESATRQPKSTERAAVIAWIGELREFEAQRNAGDPGTVLARRLSNAEYDYTIRDLTGVDIRPTREFPVDPANQAGFDN